jgi:signal transduction histidine kinase
VLRLTFNRLSSSRSFSLATLFFGGFACLTLLVSAIAILVVHDSERGYLMQAFDSISHEKLKLFEAAALDDIVAEDIPQVATTIAGFANEDPDLRFIEVTGADGIVLLHWVKPGSPDGDYQLTQRVSVAGEYFGKLDARWDTTRISAQVNRHAEEMALAVAALCILMSAVGFLLVRWFAIRPLNRIVEQLNTLRARQRVRLEPLPAYSSTEIRRLDQAVNMLSDFIDHERQRESELAVARDTAIAANKTKTEFLANMSHELRTPLNAVIGFAALMKEQTFGPLANPTYSEYVVHIHSSGEHLLALINDILDISKIEAGKFELSEETVDVREVLSGCLTFVHDRAVKSGLQLVENIPHDLARLRGDSTKLRQIFANLLSNAVKFTPAGGTVSLAAGHDEHGALRIAVRDTGIGIAREHLAKVLEPFGQVDSSYTRRVGGTGLGLPLAKSLVELHGGVLLLNSKLGSGTEVVVTLPRSRVVLDTPSDGASVVILPQERSAAARMPKTGTAAHAVVRLRARSHR